MYKCKCGSTEFKVTMLTTADVHVTTEEGYPEHILGTEDTQNISFTGPFICTRCGMVRLSVEEIEEETRCAAKRCSCGNTKFSAHQVCYHDVVVDSNNNFDRNIAIYESENPYGPYYCTECGAEYDELGKLNKRE